MKSQVVDIMSEAPVAFGDLLGPVDVLVVEVIPFEVIIGEPSME